MTVRTLNLDDVEVGERLRLVDAAQVQLLAASIAAQGQLEPVLVRPQHLKGRPPFALVIGAHRIAALRRLDAATVDASIRELDDDQARLAEIDENLCRHELTQLDRAVFLAERKALWERLHPESRAGVAGALAKHAADQGFAANDILSFAGDVAERTGLTRRTVERSIELALLIPADVRRRVSGTWLADNAAQLRQLAAVPESYRGRVLDRLLAAEPRCRDVARARALEEGAGAAAADPAEARFARFRRDWERHAPFRRRVVAWVMREHGLVRGKRDRGDDDR